MHVRAGLVRLATFLRHRSLTDRFAQREFVPGRSAHGPVTRRFPVHRFVAHRFLRRTLVVAAGTALATAGLTAVPPASHAAAATSTDAVTVNATSGLGTIPPGAIGLNTAVYDGDMNDAPIYSDIYNWQTSTAADSGYVAPGTTFSNFMSTASSAGAQPIITLNYGTGTRRWPPPGCRTPTSPTATASGSGR